MSEFLSTFARSPMLQAALLAGVLASVASGVVGSYVVVRRISYIAGGIAHSVFGGMGAAYYLQNVHGWRGFDPLYGAIVGGLLAAGVIGWVSLRAKQWEDTIIGTVWAVGMSAGVILVHATPGYYQDLFSFLFGQIQYVAASDLWLIGALDVLVLALGLGFYKQFLAICFDEEFARTRGLAVEAYYMLLLAMTALTVVLLVKVVGIILVIALLTIPAAIGGVFARRLWQVMLLAVLVSLFCTAGGFTVSCLLGQPVGATIVLLAGGLYALVLLAQTVRKRGKH